MYIYIYTHTYIHIYTYIYIYIYIYAYVLGGTTCTPLLVPGGALVAYVFLRFTNHFVNVHFVEKEKTYSHMLEQGVGQASDVNQAGLTRRQQQQQQFSRPLAGVCFLRFPAPSPGPFSTFPGAPPQAVFYVSRRAVSTFPGALPRDVFYVFRRAVSTFPSGPFLHFPAAPFYVSRRPRSTVPSGRVSIP